MDRLPRCSARVAPWGFPAASARWPRLLVGTLLCLGAAASTGAAMAQPAIPRLTGPVMDQADLLDPTQEADLSKRLKALEVDTGAQVAVLTLPSLEGEPIESRAIEVARAWELGQAGRDNGLLILVAVEERELRMEVGEGLEGAVTDLTSKRIIDEQMVPRFRQGDFGSGIVAAVEALDPVIRGEPMPEPPDLAGSTGAIIILTLFYLVITVLGLVAMATGGNFAWTVYFSVMLFAQLVPSALVGPWLGNVTLFVWMIGFPLLAATWGRSLRNRGAGSRGAKGVAKGSRKDTWLDGWTISSGGRGGSGGGSSGGWSGGGGSFGGGGASGKW